MRIRERVNGAAMAAILSGAIAACAWGLVSSGAQAVSAQARHAIAIPASLEAEHHEIHAELVKATTIAGPVGAAAKELAAVLDPHFARENQIALPPLGLLAPLAAVVRRSARGR